MIADELPRATKRGNEWERLADPSLAVDPHLLEEPDPLRPPAPVAITANKRAFTVLVRNAFFRRVELAALRRLEALEELDGDVWAAPLAAYFDVATVADIAAAVDGQR